MTTTEQDVKISRAEWIAIAAFAVSILGGTFNLGVVYADLQSQDRRLTAQENKLDALVPRIERIDANVEFLAKLAQEERIARRQ